MLEAYIHPKNGALANEENGVEEIHEEVAPGEDEATEDGLLNSCLDQMLAWKEMIRY